MHMADSLLSPAVGTAMCAVSAAALAYSVANVKKDALCEKKVPVIGVMSAFVFSAQMINFIIPGTGSSGHIGGGILLAAIIGSYPALLSMSAVLIIQCLFFADGGLLALGCNIFNMGVIPCLIVYPLLYKPLVKKGSTTAGITIASIAAVVVGLQLGSFGVVLETLFSGITVLPFASFALLMQPIHLAIGIIEGIITAAVLCFVYKMRPEIMESGFERTAVKSKVPAGNVLVILAVITLVSGGVLSLFVSSQPDGLEWSIEKIAGTTELKTEEPLLKNTAAIQERTAFMPNYDFKDTPVLLSGEEESIFSILRRTPAEPGFSSGTALAGISGGIFTFILAGISALTISIIKKKQKSRRISDPDIAASS